jgi:glycine cleavage system H protein
METYKKENDLLVVYLSKETLEAQKEIVQLEFIVSLKSTVKKNGKFAVAEGMKGTIDLLSPVDGTVVEINSALREKPEIASTDWIMKVRP